MTDETAYAIVADERQVTLLISGELDLQEADELRIWLSAGLETEPELPFVVDLAGVRFLDSIAVSQLIHAQRLARGAGREFRIENPRPPVVRTFNAIQVFQDSIPQR